MAKNSFYCPHCFNLIHTYELRYKDPKCQREIVRQANFLEKMGLTTPPKTVPCPASNYENNLKTHPEQCKKCSRIISQRICPQCEGALPSAIDDLSDITIAIIGAKGAGKSHFIALLVQRITQLFRTFDWSLQALSEGTISNYKTTYYNPLFRDEMVVDSTKKNVEPEPLMYSLKFRKNNKRVMVVFFDAAGEHFDDEQAMTTVNRYIYNASGIICLMDPLQLTPVRDEVKAHGINLPDQGSDTGEILDRLNRLLRVGFDSKGKSLGAKLIPTPLAIAFSKIDALKTTDPNYSGRLLFDSESMVYQDSRYNGYLDKNELETINNHMISWLEVADPQMNLLNQCRDFKKVNFFGFSALGAPPIGNSGKLSCPPRPNRVEDPFLWILAVNGLIDIK